MRKAWWRFLIETELITDEDLARAEALSAETDEGVEWVLVGLGLLSERALASAYADYLNIRRLRQAEMPAEPVGADRLNAGFLQHARIVPIAETDSVINVAMVDPLDRQAAMALGFAAGRAVECSVATRTDVEEALVRLYQDTTSGDKRPDDLALNHEELFDDEVGRLRDLASEAPIVRYVNILINNAIELRASDIHVEPMENRLRVRYRIDGILRDIDPPTRRAGAGIVSRIKIIAGLDIAERRLPQDGRIRLVVRGQPIDIRVSTSPTAYGESVVMRLLNRETLTLDLALLGFSDANLKQLQAMLEEPHGIVIVTGPTGSGKTTTLYAALERLNIPDRKILTIEDPVEYVIEGINQAQVKPEIGYNFATALRSFLRQDPDVIMVGEIRDTETAKVAAHAALTGHLVLSTLHTNDAPSALVRLLDMSLEGFLLTATILGIVAQRLVRVLCPECREPYVPREDLAHRYDLLTHAAGKPVRLYAARGCSACSHIGYRGRSAILEVITMTPALSAMIVGRPEHGVLRQQAIADGMSPMLVDGLKKALAGETTLEEVLRVTRDA